MVRFIKTIILFLEIHYDLTIRSDVLTNTKAAEIGIITITTAKNTLLKNALNDGVILITQLLILLKTILT